MQWFDANFRAEARENLRLAGPLIAAQLAGVGMGVVDTIWAGRLGSQTLAAVAVGTNLNVIFFVFFMGMLMACSPIVAHRAGAGEADARVGGFVRETQLLALLLGAIWVIAAHLVAAPVLLHLGLEPATAQIAVDFLRAFSWSGLGTAQWFVLRFTAEGVGVTAPTFYSGLLGLATNALLDWILMYGKFGFPAMGAIGCGWATTISSVLMAALMAWQFRSNVKLRALHVFGGRPSGRRFLSEVHEVLKLGLPIALTLVAEASLFVVAAMLMASFGDRTVAAYQVAINFASVLFMIPLGIALATTVRVGHAAGAGLPWMARARGRVGMQLGLINAASNALIMLVFPGVIVAIYTEDTAIATQAIVFLWLAAAFQFFDGLQVTANGALRGMKDTRVPMLITVAAYWLIGMPSAVALGFHTTLAAEGIWWGLTIGLGIAAIGLSLRFLHGAKASVVMP
ncbi:MAG TPA: MATE family efflux transporter [Nevskiaceae bacterium]|nr:MATE family efflux transporter [Nevskiaceae bacterium]